MTKEQLKQLESDLWSAADNLRANSDLKSSEYATPVLGLIFLKFADNNYRRHEADITAGQEEHHRKLTFQDRRQAMTLVAASQDVYNLLGDGIPVEFDNAKGQPQSQPGI